MANRGTTAAGTAGRERRISWPFVIVCGVIFLILGTIITVLFGRVRGEEFNPLTFQRRTFRYIELPLLHLQVSPIRHSSRTGPLERWLVRAGHVKAITTEPRWDFVRGHQGPKQLAPGDAAMICDYLDSRGTSDSFWLGWSKEHGKASAVLWPLIARLAREDLYVLIPETMASALEFTADDDPAELERNIRRRLAERIQRLAEAQDARGERNLARALADIGLSFDADYGPLVVLREKFGEPPVTRPPDQQAAPAK